MGPVGETEEGDVKEIVEGLPISFSDSRGAGGWSYSILSADFLISS